MSEPRSDSSEYCPDTCIPTLIVFSGKPYISVLWTDVSHFASKLSTAGTTGEIESLRRLVQAMELERSVLLMQRETREVIAVKVEETATRHEGIKSTTEPVLTRSDISKEPAQIAHEKVIDSGASRPDNIQTENPLHLIRG